MEPQEWARVWDAEYLGDGGRPDALMGRYEGAPQQAGDCPEPTVNMLTPEEWEITRALMRCYNP